MHRNKFCTVLIGSLVLLPSLYAEKTADDLITPKTRIAIEK